MRVRARPGARRRLAAPVLGLLLLLTSPTHGSGATPSDSQLPSAVSPAALPRVRLIATGGTISNRASGRLTADELIRSIPAVNQIAAVESEQFANAPSASLSLDQWLALARRIDEVCREDAGLSGIVVTSGTDTLEELAYFLHLTVRTDKPLVVVGSMRRPETPGYEGEANLLAGFRVAADPASRGRGVLVVLNDEINSARDVTKTDAWRLDTFRSGRYGLLGVVDPDRVVFYRSPERRHTTRSEFDLTAVRALPRVDIALVYQGAPGSVIRAMVDQGARGIVVASAGAGALSGTQGEAIEYALERHVVVVISTRAGGGRIAGRPQPEGKPATVPAEDLAPLKARILLMLALTRTNNLTEIQRMFADY